MSRLYGPIDREVQVAEMRHLRMLDRLETNRLIAQAREENGLHGTREVAPGFDLIQRSVLRLVQGRFVRTRQSLKPEAGAAG